MDRRTFIRKAGVAAAGALAAPWLWPGGRLFAASGLRKVNHVVFLLFAGGVRNLESVQFNDGNLMPNMLSGGSSISPDILPAMDALPPGPLSQPLQNYGTLFRQFRYKQGPTGHYNGHTVAVTGQYVNTDLNIRE
ncbi:MAG: twin-arginine translocation signal domain-containing protein, partial [Chitinophagaceae bacterium]|nr:twin-arginine translocation signal domain-containing protein [Chitinophagaceae bacterium]